MEKREIHLAVFTLAHVSYIHLRPVAHTLSTGITKIAVLPISVLDSPLSFLDGSSDRMRHQRIEVFITLKTDTQK